MDKYSLMIGGQKVADIDLNKSAEIEMQSEGLDVPFHLDYASAAESEGWKDAILVRALTTTIKQCIESEWKRLGLPKGKYSLEFEI